MPSAKNKWTYVEMVDLAVNSGHGAKVSRTKINTYIREHFGFDTSSTLVKKRVKDALDRRIDEGLLAQDKQSFVFTPAGKKAFKDQYESSEEESEPQTPKKTTSKKVEESSKKKKKSTSK
ncbi:hypothetical protein JCM3774_000869 [Rhodotorula dairenensis]